MEDEDFLDAALAADDDATPQTEKPKAETPKAAPEQAEPVTVEQPEAAEPAQQVEQPKDEQGRFVPLPTFLDMRDKLKAREAELAQFRAMQERQPAPERPDVFDDPNGAFSYQEQAFEQRLLNQTMNFSERLALREHGKEPVQAAKAWALERMQADPVFQQQVLRDPDPYEFVIQQHRRTTALDKLGDDPTEIEQFLAWKAAQSGSAPSPAAQAVTRNQPAAIPRPSLANAPSAGGIDSQVEEADPFEAEFSRKG